jgi:hypothetical protein
VKRVLKLAVILVAIVVILVGCEKKDETDKTWLSLDTTYFPFGPDYEWVYEENVKTFREGQLISEDIITYHVQVIDSSGTNSAWTFKLEGYFDDLPTTVQINADSIYVFLEGYYAKPGKTINVVKPETDTLTDLFHKFSIEYAGETLEVKLTYATDKEGEVGSRCVSRLRGKGTISQTFSFTSPPDSQYIRDKTLFLRKGQDTVWKAD